MAITDAAELAPLKNTARIDFAAVATAAFEEFPGLRDVLIFYNHDDDQIVSQGNVLDRALNGPYRRQFCTDDGKPMEPLEFLQKKTGGPAIQPLGPLPADPKILLYASDALDNLYFPAGTSKIQETLAIEHELGHVLLNEKLEYTEIAKEIERPDVESEADAFGILRTARQFGSSARQFLSNWSLERSFEAIDTGNPDHLTTFPIDGVLLDARSAPSVSLTTEEVKAIARHHAREFLPPDKDVLKIVEAFKPLLRKLRTITADNTAPLRELADIITQDDVNPYAVYMGARILKEFLKPGGIEFSGKNFRGVIELKNEEWDDVKERISAALSRIPSRHRLQQLELNKLDVTGKLAPPSLPPALIPFAGMDFNAVSADFSVSSVDIKDAPESVKDLVLAPVAEVLAIFAAPGFQKQGLDILVTQPWRDKARSIVEEDRNYQPSIEILTNSSNLGISMNIVKAADANGQETPLLVIEDTQQGKSLVVGEGVIGAAARDLQGSSVTYVAKSAPGAATAIDAFICTSQETRTVNIKERLICAYSCLCEIPASFLQTDGGVRPNVTVGAILAATPNDGTAIYTSIMKPKAPTV
jgi:hypothetical protein